MDHILSLDAAERTYVTSHARAIPFQLVSTGRRSFLFNIGSRAPSIAPSSAVWLMHLSFLF